MKKKIVSIIICLLLVATMGFVLASNKAKIDKAARPVKENPVIPVTAFTVTEDSFSTAFSINGMTAPEREVKIASEVQGKLAGLYIRNGDFVGKGQVIASLDASVYQVQLNTIESSIAKANLDLKRYTKLISLGGATPMQAESVELQIHSLVAQKKEVLEQIEHMQIRAPFSGRIENVSVEQGSFVSYGTALAQLLDNSSLKINVYLSEQEAFRVKAGQPVSIHSVVLAEPGQGKISMISDKADASGKFLAEISFDNSSKQKLKAGMLADVAFTSDAVETGLSIPVSAITGSTKESKVFVVKGKTVEQRIIRTGIVTASKVQVLGGLQKGEQVVISGQLNLKTGTAVIVNQ